MDKYDVEGIEDFRPGSGNVVTVENGEKIIAHYSFDCAPTAEGDIAYVIPHLANVVDGYQRKGISTELIRMINQDCNYEIRFDNAVNNTVEDKNMIHYSAEGLNWMQKCCTLGYSKRDDENDSDDDLLQ